MIKICYTEEDAKEIIMDYWMEELGTILTRSPHFDKICELFTETLNSDENTESINKIFRSAVDKATMDYAKLNYKVIGEEQKERKRK